MTTLAQLADIIQTAARATYDAMIEATKTAVSGQSQITSWGMDKWHRVY